MQLDHLLRATTKSSAANIKFISSSTTINPSTGSSLILNLPTDNRANDVLVAIGVNSRGGAGATWTPPAGFTEVYDQGSSPNLFVAYRTATGAETSTYTWTASSTQGYCSGTMLRYRNAEWFGIGTDNPARGAGDTFPVATGDSTVYYLNALRIAIFGDGTASQTFTTPTDMTLRTSDTNATSPSFAVFDGYVQGVFPDASSTLGASSSTYNAIMVQLILKDSIVLSEYSGTTYAATNYSTTRSASFTVSRGSGSVSLSGGYTFNKNGGAYSATGTVTAGDVITLQGTSPSALNTLVTYPAVFGSAGYQWSIDTSTRAVFTSAGTRTIQLSGITTASMLCLGAGGGGGGNTPPGATTNNGTGGGGGGGGGLSYTNNLAIPTQTVLTVSVGSGGTGGPGVSAGGSTSIVTPTSTLVLSNGGLGGGNQAGGGGGGGPTTGAVGTVKFSGGSGGSYGFPPGYVPFGGSSGGSGGGSASTGSNGSGGSNGSLINNTWVGGGPGTSEQFGATSYTITPAVTNTTTITGSPGTPQGAGGGGSGSYSGYGGTTLSGGSGGSGAAVIVWGGRTFSPGTTY